MRTGLEFSANPTNPEISCAHLFEEPLLPVGGEPTRQENRALAAALLGYARRSSPDDFTSLTRFLDQYPNSAWRAALLTDLGLEYYNTAHYSRALAAWQQAWPLAKTATEPRGKAIADRTAGELAFMYGRLGRMQELEALLKSVEGRVFVGPATERISSAREGLWTMQHRPEVAFRCGPLALLRIQKATMPSKPADMAMYECASTQRGMSLPQVAEISRQIGLNYQMAFREAAGELVAPAVVHWKLGHYAAIIRREGDRYLLQDPTFLNDVWATRRTVEEESSGYFLIPPGPLEKGWRSVAAAEGQTVWGKGNTQTKEPGLGDPRTPSGPCKGMAVSSVNLMLVNLNLRDEPVGYSPPVGPSVHFTVSYNHRDSFQPGTFTYANFGPKWTCDWVAYIKDNPQSLSADVNYYVPGGGNRVFTGFSTNTQTYAYQQYDQTLLKRTAPAQYEMLWRDGSKYLFGQPDGSAGTSRKVFLSQVVDARGNTVTLNYDGSLRLVGITDAIGQVTSLSYSNSSDIYKVTRVTDPFGRLASFDYDLLGRLTNVTDVIGMTSQFIYETNSDYISNLVTPYGTTTFVRGESGTTRWLETTYPDGSRDRVEFNQSTTLGISGSDAPSSVPQGMATDNRFLYYRNTYYWSRNACATAYGDYTKARLYHWLHTSDVTMCSGILESTKQPLEGRVWFDYAGQSGGPIFVGTNNLPTHSGRVLDDGTTQLFTRGYNGFGNLTNTIDPLGRTFSYMYDTNGIDLLEVRMTRAGKNELLFKATYNSQHLPLTTAGADGQPTTNTYNARGQILTTANPRGETTTYTYDSNGYLIAVDGPLPGTNDTRTASYDAYGRIATVTDVDGYSVTNEYDALNRVTTVTLPDSTFYQITYDRLNPGVLRDRAGRETRLQYNPLGQLAQRTDPMGRVTQFQWCNCGAIKSQTDPLGRTTEWHTDVQGRLTAKQYGDGSKVSYSYENASGRLFQIVDEKLQVKQLAYNRDNTLCSISYLNGAVPTATVSYTYDPDYRRIASMIDGLGTSLYSYQPISGTPTLGAGQLMSVDGPYANDTITYSYDELGRAVSTAIDGAAQATTYDAMGRVSRETNALGSFTYAYDGSSGRMLAEVFPNGQTTTNTFADNLHDQRLAATAHRVGPTALCQFLYTHDVPTGRITSWSQQFGVEAPDIYSFGYDDSDRLVSASVTNSGAQVNAFAYAYDAADNRLLEVIGATTNLATCNALNQLSTSSAPNAARTNEWDAEDRLVAVNADGERIEFFYDGESRLAGIRRLTNGVQASFRRFVWCGQMICEERDESGGMATKRFYQQGMRIEEGPNAGSYYYSRDHLGSVRELTDSGGAVRARYSYDPYGRRTRIAGDLDADLGFAGMFWSSESGLSLTWWRAYDPQVGRWLSRDPLENAEMREGPNLYAYVGGNPVNLTDPFGLDRGREQAEKAWAKCEEAVADWYGKWLAAKRVCDAADQKSFSICSKAERGSAKSFFSKCQAALRQANAKCRPLSDATQAAWKRLTDCGSEQCAAERDSNGFAGCLKSVYDLGDELTDSEPWYPKIAYAAGWDPKTKTVKCYVQAY